MFRYRVARPVLTQRVIANMETMKILNSLNLCGKHHRGNYVHNSSYIRSQTIQITVNHNGFYLDQAQNDLIDRQTGKQTEAQIDKHRGKRCSQLLCKASV